MVCTDLFHGRYCCARRSHGEGHRYHNKNYTHYARSSPGAPLAYRYIVKVRRFKGEEGPRKVPPGSQSRSISSKAWATAEWPAEVQCPSGRKWAGLVSTSSRSMQTSANSQNVFEERPSVGFRKSRVPSWARTILTPLGTSSRIRPKAKRMISIDGPGSILSDAGSSVSGPINLTAALATRDQLPQRSNRAVGGGRRTNLPPTFAK